MKKLILFISAILIVTASGAETFRPIAQKISERKLKKETFRQVRLFDVTGTSLSQNEQLKDKVKDATIMEFRANEALAILQDKPENLIFIIPSGSGSNILLELYKTNFYAPDFSIIASDGRQPSVDGGVHYWGIVRGDNASIASISIFNDEVMGMISSPTGGNLVLGKLENNQDGLHILYGDRNLSVLPTTQCGTPDTQESNSAPDFSSAAVASPKCIRLYWEANYDLFQNKGSLTAVSNYLTGLFSQSALLYANDSIPVSLSQLYIWTGVSPFTSTTTSGLLGQFKSTRTSFNGDLAALIGLAGGGGIAYVDAFCTTFNYSYSGISTSYSNIPTFSWSVEVITHEQGHMMGSSHTHDCVWNGNNTAIDGCGPAAGYGSGSCSTAPVPANGGTIMSYCHLVSAGINFSLGFGPQPRTLILNNINSSACLAACNGVTCSVPSGMATAAITSSTATFNWAAVSGASGYTLQFRRTGTTSWTSVNTTAATYAASALTAGSTYEWQVQTICTGGASAFTTSSTFTTAAASCAVPSGLSTTAITTSTATFNWTAVSGASSYNLQFRKVGTTSWTGTSTVSTSYNASALTAGSNYEWKVQTICAGGTSAFTASSTFLTISAPCTTPTGIATTAVTTSTATLSWTTVSGASSYLLQFRKVGTTSWTGVNTASTSYPATGLTVGTSYEWQVQTICSGGSSAFSSLITFTTTASTACSVPTGLTTTLITSSSAKFNWPAVSGAVSYNVHYRLVGSASWISLNTGLTSYNSSMLTSGSVYEWQVQTVCSGGSSAYSTSATFTTVSQACNAPSGLTAVNIANSSATLSWTAVSGVNGYNLQWKNSAASQWTTVSGITTSTYNLAGLSSCTAYQFQVQTSCAAGASSFSAVSSFATSGCSLTYCTSKGSNTSYEYINKVAIGTISNTSGDNGGYGNFTSISTNLAGGSSNTIALTPGFRSSSYREYWTVWIDYNHNGVFTDAGEKAVSANGTGSVNGVFIVPATALNGAARMRIQMQYNSQLNNSCASYTYGEVEDYTVVVNGNAQIEAMEMPASENSSLESQRPVSLSLYPNPATDQLTADVSFHTNGSVIVNVLNILGKQILSLENRVEEGMNRISLNTSELVSGIYIFEIKNKEEITREKFMISR